MKYVVYTLILFIILIILSVFNSKKEGFTVYQIDYGTGIGPWWAQGAGAGAAAGIPIIFSGG